MVMDVIGSRVYNGPLEGMYILTDDTKEILTTLP